MKYELFVLAFGYFFMLNQFFGWNALPKSKEELICDGILFILIAVAYLGLLVNPK